MQSNHHNHFPITLYYDGLCPLCAAEMQWLKTKDKQNNLELVDIKNPLFKSPSQDLSLEQLDTILHVKLKTGEYVKGIDAYYYAWAAIGLGWLAAPMRWKGVRYFSDKAYLYFAKNRHPISARFARLTGKKGCEDGQCKIPPKK